MSIATAIELFHADGKPSGVWYCSDCRAVHNNLQGAQSCHGVTHCVDCGKELGKRQPYYRTQCDECNDKQWREKQSKEEFERYTKASKISSSDYTGTQVYLNDHYYETVWDAIEDCDQPPEYVWSTKEVGLRKASVDDLIERVLEEAWEDAESDDLYGVEDLQKAVDAFNEANASIPVYMVDYSQAIVLDEQILAEWKRDSER